MEKTLASRYQIVRHLGGGGFGQTFLAKDTHLPGNPLCVVKQFKPIVSTPATLQVAKRLFDREAETLYKLGDGDRIPRLLAHFQQAEEFYLVQEYIDGQSLDKEIGDRAYLNESSIIALLRDILQLLTFVHQQNVIHRDIKPANLIRRRQDGKIILIDFGAVKEVSTQTINQDGSTSLTVAIGSPGYMPSEQQAGKPHFSSDIYAVGMVCIQALTGLSPRDIQPDANTGEISCALFKKNATVRHDLAEIIDKMVRYDYRQRYQNATEALQALEQLIYQREQESYEAPTEIYPSDKSANLQVSSIINEEVAVTEAPLDATSAIPVKNSPVVAAPIAPNSPESPTIPLNRQEYINRQILLNKVKNAWIKGVLEKSLHGQASIILGLEEGLNAVESPAMLAWETPDRSRQILPAGTKAIAQFDQLGIGRTLLILGEPGAGKTITLLELARDLIERAEKDVNLPMPVVLNLSSWKGGKQAIADWLVEELNSQYQVSKEIGRIWVKNEQLLLLLDGLDEVRSDRRDSCVQILNKFRQECGQTEMVICSRITDYESLKHRLRLEAAVYVQPLTLAQIQYYLNNAGAELTAVRTALQTDIQLQELAKSPLMLNIIAIAYRGMSLDDLPSMNLEERRQHLFDAYIERMFGRRGAGDRYPRLKAQHWLIWLAQRMVEESQTVFFIERMQPKLLQKTWQKQLYFLSIWSSFLLVGFWIGQQLLDIQQVLVLLLFVGGFFWYYFGVYRINPVETLRWSWDNARKNTLRGLIYGAIAGLILKIIYDIIFHLPYWDLSAPDILYKAIFSLIRGTVFGLSIGLIFGLVRGLNSPCIETITAPNQGMRQSAKNAIVFGVIGFVGLAIAAALLHWRSLYWGVFGFAFGLVAGGGEACFKHFILRVILYYNGYIPWNYASFLDWATERIFLQKVGGGYIFIHRLLLEHFAASESNQD